MGGCLALLFTLAVPACAGLSGARVHEGPFPAEVTADWDDLGAAMSRSTLRTQTAVLSRTEVGSGEAGSRVRLELISVRDEQLWVEFEALEGWPTPEGGPVPITITAGSLLPETDELQRAVVGELAHHLRALAGKGFAPSN